VTRLCSKGHLMLPDNTISFADGTSTCRECARLRGERRKNRPPTPGEQRRQAVLREERMLVNSAMQRGGGAKARVKLPDRYERIPECHGRLRVAEDALRDGSVDFARAQLAEAVSVLQEMLGAAVRVAV
jgi:hypothetical protein